MPSYYIYYRVADAASAAALVERLQGAVLERTGIRGRVLKKRGEPGLWMEIYEDVIDGVGFERVLGQAVEEVAFDRTLQPGSSRRVECFEPA